ncbi:MAG TPA: hypothetical protein VHE83_07775 [Mycobacteriales bacterium]|nr:hypothetical protein [Mycobacteriales bacterium]
MDLLPVRRTGAPAVVTAVACAAASVVAGLARLVPAAVPITAPVWWLVLAGTPLLVLVVSEVGYLRARRSGGRPSRSVPHTAARLLLESVAVAAVLAGPAPGSVPGHLPAGVAWQLPTAR